MTLILAAEAVRTALLLTAIDAKLGVLAQSRLVATADVSDFLLDLRLELTR